MRVGTHAAHSPNYTGKMQTIHDLSHLKAHPLDVISQTSSIVSGRQLKKPQGRTLSARLQEVFFDQGQAPGAQQIISTLHSLGPPQTKPSWDPGTGPAMQTGIMRQGPRQGNQDSEDIRQSRHRRSTHGDQSRTNTTIPSRYIAQMIRESSLDSGEEEMKKSFEVIHE